MIYQKHYTYHVPTKSCIELTCFFLTGVSTASTFCLCLCFHFEAVIFQFYPVRTRCIQTMHSKLENGNWSHLTASFFPSAPSNQMRKSSICFYAVHDSIYLYALTTTTTGGIMPSSTGILYQNDSATVFLLDIPTTIAVAQELSPLQQQQCINPSCKSTDSTTSTSPSTKPRKILFSSSPQEEPFTSIEPKSERARARVLERISESERIYHACVIRPRVEDALEEIRRRRRLLRSNSFAETRGCEDGRWWCLARRVVEEQERSSTRGALMVKFRDAHGGGADARRGKRMRRSSEILSATNAGVREVRDAGNGLEESPRPPMVLSSTCDNRFDSLQELEEVVVQNPACEPAILTITWSSSPSPDGEEEISLSDEAPSHRTVYIPPMSRFVRCTLPLSRLYSNPELVPPSNPIPGLPRAHQFDLVLLDPPWPNRSVRRSGHYRIQEYDAMSALTQQMQTILRTHLRMSTSAPPPNSVEDSQDTPVDISSSSMAAIWITNAERSRKAAYDALTDAGLTLCEEWIWIKTTVSGQPVSAIDGLWRKPYEILVIGRDRRGWNSGRPEDADSTTAAAAAADIIRRVIAGVPDIHSRKPNLKELFERLFFAERRSRYDALEVFARNLTAGWCACGDEVLKFNFEEWWTDGG